MLVHPPVSLPAQISAKEHVKFQMQYGNILKVRPYRHASCGRTSDRGRAVGPRPGHPAFPSPPLSPSHPVPTPDARAPQTQPRQVKMDGLKKRERVNKKSRQARKHGRRE